MTVNSKLADILRHLVRHSGGYATEADKIAHLAAVAELAGEAKAPPAGGEPDSAAADDGNIPPEAV